MEIIPVPRPFQPDEGFAYQFPLAAHATLGDCSDEPKRSPLLLLEDGAALGPAHAHHYAIRQQGQGRFSHWKDVVYFSASDNSNPNVNGRTYALGMPSWDDITLHQQSLVERAGGDAALTFAVLRSAFNTNGSALALYLNAFGSYRTALREAGLDFRGKTILEIGSGPHLGTALAFLLHGAGRVICNDIGPMAGSVSRDYAHIIQLFAKAVDPSGIAALEAVTEAGAEPGVLSLARNRFTAIPSTGAEAIDLPAGSVDLIVSTSVLEHVMRPTDVLANTFRLLAPGGCSVHSIDLRDHANPLEPLGFLKKTRAAYEPGGTENRIRARDFVDIFTRVGFEVARLTFFDNQVAVDELGNVDGMSEYLSDRSSQPVHGHSCMETIVPWVTEAERSTFDEEFRTKTLQDLSVLGLAVVARKPATGRREAALR